MPIFFAFYKVLSAAIELVGAPFIFWINDLSIKDPYLCYSSLTVVMFLQQKITPMQTTDDTQKKVMLFMPIILVYNEGLTVALFFTFCFNLFGILQQLFVYKTVD